MLSSTTSLEQSSSWTLLWGEYWWFEGENSPPPVDETLHIYVSVSFSWSPCINAVTSLDTSQMTYMKAQLSSYVYSYNNLNKEPNN